MEEQTVTRALYKILCIWVSKLFIIRIMTGNGCMLINGVNNYIQEEMLTDSVRVGERE